MKFAGRDFKKNPLKREDTQIRFDDPEVREDEAPFRAQQCHNEGKCLDTTSIVSKFLRDGIITHTRDASARYVDASHFIDFQDAMTVKARADQAYEMLPAEIRKQFDSQKDFVKFALDEKNLDKLREWGLATPLKTPETIQAPASPAPVQEPKETPTKPA